MADGVFHDGVMQECPHNAHWFWDVQRSVSQTSRLARLYELIGTLCVARKQLGKNCGPDCPDAEAFGIAYKDSLDVAKHGRKIRFCHNTCGPTVFLLTWLMAASDLVAFIRMKPTTR